MKFFHGMATGPLAGSHSHEQSTAFLSGLATSPGSDVNGVHPIRTTNGGEHDSAPGEGRRQRDRPRKPERRNTRRALRHTGTSSLLELGLPRNKGARP